MRKNTSSELLPLLSIEQRILLVRGHRVMLDRDLASLYGVKPIALRQQVKRNPDRFPADFMFQLSAEEVEVLLSQNVIASRRNLGGFLPYVFTQEGVAMLSSVLHSSRAAHVNVAIMRAFVKMRTLLGEHKELSRKIEDLERKYSKHDNELRVVFETLRELMQPARVPSKRRIGF